MASIYFHCLLQKNRAVYGKVKPKIDALLAKNCPLIATLSDALKRQLAMSKRMVDLQERWALLENEVQKLKEE